MKKIALVIIPILFTAQACNFLFGDLRGEQGSGPRGVFFSTDSGETWEARSAISEEKTIASSQVLEIETEKGNTDNLLLASYELGVFASENEGEEWIPLMPKIRAYDVLFTPADDQLLFASGSSEGYGVIFKSIDRGGTWTEVFRESKSGTSVVEIAFDPANEKTLYAAISSGAVVESFDQGQSWSKQSEFSGRFRQLEIGGGSIYAVFWNNKPQRSDDGGATWTDLKLESKSTEYNTLILDPEDSSVIYLGSDSGLFRSSDKGRSWVKLELPTGPSGDQISALAVNPDDNDQIFAAVRSVMYRSNDRGLTWQTMSIPTRRTVADIEIDPENPNQIYIGLKN